MAKQWNVLVVDDFAPMRNTIRIGLEQSGLYKVFACGTAVHARQLMEHQDFDLVICDINMPGQSGIEFLQQLRATPAYQYLPFMLMTGDGSRPLVTSAIRLGVSGFIVKPFTLSLLKEKVAEALKSVPSPAGAAEKTKVVTELQAPSQIEPQAKASILVVDDEASNLELVHHLLKTDYRVKVVTSGQKALQLVASEPPDLILLDIMMPGMDGFEVCRQLQTLSTADIPVIFLSAKTAVDDVTTGLGLGAVDYIYKPLEPEILKARIRTQLALRQSRQHLRQSIEVLQENARLQTDIQHMTHHDLINPLSGVLVHLGLLLGDEAFPSVYKDQLQQIQQSAEMALSLVEQNTNLLKMEQGLYRVQPEAVNMAEVLRQVQQDLTALTEQKQLQIRQSFTAKPPIIKGEYLLCYFIFSNLLKNALEAAPEKTEIELSCTEAGHYWSISMLNQGVIPDAIRHAVFDKYVTQGKPQGTGLGLYSVQLMTQVQQGGVQCSTKGNSSVFTVTLPKY